MTKIFVPVFAVALLTIGTLNAQTHKGKPAPAKKKVTVPVNRVPVPVARPMVPVAKPAATVTKPAPPVVAKPAPPKPAPKAVVAPKPVRKPVVTKNAAPVKKAPAAITKSPVKKKATTRRVIVRKAKASPVNDRMEAPAPRSSAKRYEEHTAPEPKRVIEERIVIRDDRNDEMESESGNHRKGSCEDHHAATNGPLSIDGCDCYSHRPHGCKPWKFRNRRYYRYQYTMQHYRGCSGDGCNGGCKK